MPFLKLRRSWYQFRLGLALDRGNVPPTLLRAAQRDPVLNRWLQQEQSMLRRLRSEFPNRSIQTKDAVTPLPPNRPPHRVSRLAGVVAVAASLLIIAVVVQWQRTDPSVASVTASDKSASENRFVANPEQLQWLGTTFDATGRVVAQVEQGVSVPVRRAITLTHNQLIMNLAVFRSTKEIDNQTNSPDQSHDWRRRIDRWTADWNALLIGS